MAQTTPPSLPHRQSDVVPPSSAPASTLQPLDLEKELSCSICTDILYQPLTLLDCLHTFCGSCLKEWFGWQVRAAESQPERNSSVPYTCPSCRAPVRDTRPNATVTTLLEMYLQVNPVRVKNEAEIQDIAQKYKQGENVLPRRVNSPVEQLNRQDTSSDLDEDEDRRLLQEVREMSLRDMEQDRSGNRRTSRERQDRRHARHRRRGERSRSRRNEDTSPHGAARRELESQLRARGSLRAGQSLRTLEHQASLRTLMNRSGTGSEVSHAVQGDIMREIFEGGLLDELDFTNIDTEDQEAVSELIAKAYIERHRRGRANVEGNARPTAERATTHTQSNPPVSRPRLLDVMQPESARQRSSSSQINRSSRDHSRRRSSADQTSSTLEARSREGDTSRQQHHPRWRTSEGHQQRDNSEPRSQARVPAQPDSHSSSDASPTMPEACTSCSRMLHKGELHYICPQCPSSHPGAPVAVCRRCYRMGQGCMRRHKGVIATSNSSSEPTHFMKGQRFVATTDSSSSIPASTISQAGLFCEHCSVNCNNCYWHCSTCNLGEYGFCHSCVIQARHCTHPLEPLFLYSHCTIPIDEPATMYTTSLPILTTCNSCGNGIPTTNARFHCPICNNGDYDLCQACYNSQVENGQISTGNGPSGWRKCERGHRMLVIGFIDGSPKKRTILQTVVGGWRMPEEDTLSSQEQRIAKVPEVGFTWHDAATDSWRHKKAESQSPASTEASRSPHPASPDRERSAPAGGYGAKVQALWARVPDDGPAGEDELAFPKRAEITEVFEINESWSWGVYCRQGGMFPTAYGRFRNANADYETRDMDPMMRTLA